MNKDKILPLIELKYFKKKENGDGPKDKDIACSLCAKSNVSLGSAIRGLDGEYQNICEDCSIGNYQAEHEFTSREAAEARRRRIFDVGYLLQEMIIDKYLLKKGFDSIDDLNKQEFNKLLELGKQMYNAQFSRGAKHELEETQSQKKIATRLSSVLTHLFEDEKSLRKITSSYPDHLEIKFSRDQYLNLLKMSYLGNWMINAQRTGTQDDKYHEEYDDLESYIFSFAQKIGIGAFMDEGRGRYYPSWDFSELTDVDSLHEEYDDDNFWDELINRLADRDTKRELGDRAGELSHEQFFSVIGRFEEKYADEIDKYALERIVIDESLKPNIDDMNEDVKD